jgi:hypothetical protein
MPDNGICERFHRTVLDEFYRFKSFSRSYSPSERATLFHGTPATHTRSIELSY